MSTNSTIGTIKEDKIVTHVYCHWDGYVSYNGRMLYENYKTQEQVDELLSFGDISSLGKTTQKRVKDDDGYKCDYNGTEFYIRDRDEPVDQCSARTEPLITFNNYEYFTYMFKDGTWYLFDDNSNELIPIKDILDNPEKYEEWSD